MFEFITNPEDRGQVGIGTLIVFIAMVLVAAIAAGVLINTAGFLQTQAEATGEESTDLVSERIDVTSEVGIVGSEANGELDEIRLSVSGAPGADQIDLSETTIQAVGPGGQENLVFTDQASTDTEVTQLLVTDVADTATQFDVTIETDNIDNGDNPVNLAVDVNSGSATGNADTSSGTGTQTLTVTTDASGGDINLDTTAFSSGDTISLTLSNADMSSDITAEETVADNTDTEVTTTETQTDQQVSSLGANEFAVGSDGNFESTPVLDEENDYTILINPDAGAFADTGPFGEGQSATLDIVSPAGATTSVELRAPDLFNKNGEAVRL